MRTYSHFVNHFFGLRRPQTGYLYRKCNFGLSRSPYFHHSIMRERQLTPVYRGAKGYSLWKKHNRNSKISCSIVRLHNNDCYNWWEHQSAFTLTWIAYVHSLRVNEWTSFHSITCKPTLLGRTLDISFTRRPYCGISRKFRTFLGGDIRIRCDK